MRRSYKALKPEYETLLASDWRITRPAEAKRRATRILKLKSRYLGVSQKTGVPIVWLMAINERESGSRMNTYLGNGQSLKLRTTLVPAGRGPFRTWEAGALDALHLLRLDRIKDWDWPRALYEGERWNGFGPRGHGKRTGYLWAGTSLYTGGKYVSDGAWRPRVRDTQLGIVPLIATLLSLDPSLDL